ncbi:MAG: tape measure protein [Coriobacteriia bacterium]|nr:tape measure protein [Coriobacteriia bacterium]
MAANLGSGYISVIPKMQGNLSQIVGKACSSASATGSAALTKGFSTAGVMVGNVLAMGLGKAMGAISSSLSGAITKIDTFERFPLIMQNMGFSAEQAAASIEQINSHLKGLPTSSVDAVNSIRQFAAMNGDLQRSTDIFLALNDALRIGGAGAEEQATAMQMLMRMYATGKVQSRGYVKVLQTMGGTLTEVAHKLGYSSAELGGDMVEALNKGKLSMDDFMNAIIDLDKNGGEGFKSLEERAKEMPLTIEEQMTMMHKSITGSLANIINEIGTQNITSIIDTIGNTFKSVAGVITPVVKVFADFLNVIQPAVPAIAGVAATLITLKGAFSILSSGAKIAKTGFDIVKGAASVAGGALEKLVAKFTAKSLIDSFASVREAGVAIGETGSSVKGAADKASKGASTMKGAGDTISQAGDTMSKGSKKASKSFKDLTGSALQIVAIGGAVALAGVGFRQFGEGAAVVGQQGPLAVAALAIMGATFAGVVAEFTLFGQNLQGAALGIIAVGGAIAIASAGLAALGASAALVGSQGGPGIAALGIMSATMIILVPLFAALGPALDVAAPGMLAFGGAVLMAGAGLGAAAAGGALLVAALADLVRALGEFAEKSGMAQQQTQQVTNAFDGLNSGVGKAVDGIGSAINGIGDLIGGLGKAAEGLGSAVQAWGLNQVADALNRMREASEGASNSLNGIGGACDAAGGALSNLAGTGSSTAYAIQGSFDGLSNSIFGVSNQIVGSITNGFNTAKNNAIAACNELVASANSVFNNIGDSAYWAGVHIGEGLANGIRSQEGNVASAASALAAQADIAIRKKAEISSPSKVAKREGAFFGSGWIQGIQSMYKKAREASEGLMKTATPKFEKVRQLDVVETLNNLTNLSLNVIAPASQPVQDKRPNQTINFYDVQTSPDAISQKMNQINTYGLARSYG